MNFQDIVILKSMRREEFLDKTLREHAVPPIKGEITKGKIRWRGIKACQQGNALWLEQRGKQIGDKLIEDDVIFKQWKL